ncbi:MAG: MotA/TolQ/ExbB proton channel family protein, partial [Planctomycetota bacterium]
MDIATILGLLVGTFLVLLAIFMGGDFMAYMNAPSVLIVVGGATCATLASYPLAKFCKFHQVVAKTLFDKSSEAHEVIRQLVELAEVARRDGI